VCGQEGGSRELVMSESGASFITKIPTSNYGVLDTQKTPALEKAEWDTRETATL
jgi:hypothetical protein